MFRRRGMYSISHLLLLLIISYGHGLSIGSRAMEISFILDFIKVQNSPKNILENLCWIKDDKMKLQRELTERNYRYRAFNKDLNIFGNYYNPYFYTVLVNVECDFESFLKKALETTLVVYPNVWILFGNFDKIKQLNYYFPINSLFVILVKTKNTSFSEIKTIYKINKKFNGYVEMSLGNWSNDLASNMMKNHILIRDRTDFRGMPLRISYIVTDNGTFEHLTDYRNKHVDNLTKINYKLYDFICDLLNATQIRLMISDWGFEVNSTFTHGMFEDLVYDKSDAAGTVSFTPASRSKYLKYVFAPIKDFSVHFVFRAPSLAYYTNIFVLPFDSMVWLTIGILFIVCSVFINVVFSWESQEKAFTKNLKQGNENSPSLLDVVMMQVAIVCQMDTFYEPKSVSGKILTFVVLITSTFIYTAFSAKIVWLLQSHTNKIDDLESLYAANFEFGAENQKYNIFYFQAPADRSNEYWRKLIYEKKIKKPSGNRFFKPTDGMKLVRDSYFAFHVEQTVANYLIDTTFSTNQKCALRVVDAFYKADVPHLAVPRNSSYIEFLTVRRLAETGVHNREYRRCFTKKPSCEGKANEFVSVGLIESYFSFLVFGSGICLSIIIFLLEILAYYRFKFHCAL